MAGMMMIELELYWTLSLLTIRQRERKRENEEQSTLETRWWSWCSSCSPFTSCFFRTDDTVESGAASVTSEHCSNVTIFSDPSQHLWETWLHSLEHGEWYLHLYLSIYINLWCLSTETSSEWLWLTNNLADWADQTSLQTPIISSTSGHQLSQDNVGRININQRHNDD